MYVCVLLQRAGFSVSSWRASSCLHGAIDSCLMFGATYFMFLSRVHLLTYILYRFPMSVLLYCTVQWQTNATMANATEI
jgi:hypothetical protein